MERRLRRGGDIGGLSWLIVVDGAALLSLLGGGFFLRRKVKLEVEEVLLLLRWKNLVIVAIVAGIRPIGACGGVCGVWRVAVNLRCGVSNIWFIRNLSNHYRKSRARVRFPDPKEKLDQSERPNNETHLEVGQQTQTRPPTTETIENTKAHNK
jgi:hypothetical protein